MTQGRSSWGWRAIGDKVWYAKYTEDNYWEKAGPSLYYTGARWMVWIPNVMVAEVTEFTDRKNPPCEWALDMWRLANDITD